MSRIYFMVILFTFVLCGYARARAADNLRPEDQVAQLERDWLAADAKGDAPSITRLLADDFMGSSFDGHLLSKQDIIPQGGGPGGFAGATPSETSVRVFGNGDTAVLMGFIKTNDQSQIHVILICQKRGQNWQIIAAHLQKM